LLFWLVGSEPSRIPANLITLGKLVWHKLREGVDAMALKRVLVELRAPEVDDASIMKVASSLESLGFALDASYKPISMDPKGHTVCIRGEIEEGKEKELEASPNVVKVWSDARIVPLSEGEKESDEGPNFNL
jgi:hypothetical protein